MSVLGLSSLLPPQPLFSIQCAQYAFGFTNLNVTARLGSLYITKSRGKNSPHGRRMRFAHRCIFLRQTTSYYKPTANLSPTQATQLESSHPSAFIFLPVIDQLWQRQASAVHPRIRPPNKALFARTTDPPSHISLSDNPSFPSLLLQDHGPVRGFSTQASPARLCQAMFPLQRARLLRQTSLTRELSRLVNAAVRFITCIKFFVRGRWR